MQITRIVLFVLLISSLHSKECVIDDRVMYGIASVERHSKTPIGYPYLISLNLKSEQKIAHADKTIQKYFLDRRTIDCENTETCVAILDRLLEIKIDNLDIGCFQFNYIYWKLPKGDYFDVQKSYNKACSIIMSLNKKEWTWENIAKYHSKTKKHNLRYKRSLLAVIKRDLEK